MSSSTHPCDMFYVYRRDGIRFRLAASDPAVSRKLGKVELARNGTLFLDEIDDIERVSTMFKIPKLFRVSLLPIMTLAIMVITLLSQPLPIASAPFPDFDGNGVVDISDFLLFVSAFGSRRGEEKYEAKYDLDGDGEIGISDFLIFTSSFGKIQSATYQQFVEAKENGTEPIVPDFSYAGYHYFSKPIPNVTHPIFDVTDYGAIPNDNISDQPAIVSAIAAAEANGRGIVFFPPGDFLVNTDTDKNDEGNNEPITIRSSNIILRGSGSRTGGTIIRMVNPQIPSGTRMFNFTTPSYTPNLTRITESADRETFWITVEDVSKLEVGQWIRLEIKSTEAINEYLSPYLPKPEWTMMLTDGIELKEKHSIAEIRGNRVRLNEPLHTHINHKYNWKVQYRPYIEEIGVEDISFHGMWLDKFAHYNNLGPTGWNVLSLTRCINSWVRRVSFVNCPGPIHIGEGSAVSVYHVTMAGNGGHTSIGINDSYGVWVGLTEDLANHFHGPAISHRTTGAVYWRYDMSPNQPIDAHSQQPYANLLDFVKGGRLSGSGGGKNSLPHHLRHYVIWNFNHGGNPTHYDFWDINKRYGFILQPIIVGFHGNPATFNEDNVQILESNGSSVEPASLFEAQLELRMGSVPVWLNALRTEWETLRNTRLPNASPVTRGTIPTQTLSVGTHRKVDAAEYLIDPDIFVDPNTPPLTYSVSSSNEGIATADVTGSVVTITPVMPGSATITVTATDVGGLTTTQAIEVIVSQTTIEVKKLYWTDEETEKIQRSNLDGTDVEDIITSGLKDPVSIALDESAGKMYWVDRNTDKIYRASLDGTKVKELVNTRGLSEPPSSSYKSAAPYGIALDVAGSKMYWTDQVQEKIWRANLDGSNVEALVNTTDLASDGTNPSSIALDVAGGKMYWANWDTNKIHRADLNGSNVEEVITSGVTFSRGITLDLINRKIYYTDTSTDKIRRANLDGTNVEELVDTKRIVDPPLDNGGTSPLDITLDVNGGKMYWADSKMKKILRANLDGTQVEILPISGLQRPVGIAVISSNSAPVTRGIISTKTLSVGTDEIIDMSDYFSDPDNDVLTYIASSSNESIATVVVMGSQVTVSPVISGQATITVTVTDAGGLMVSQTVEVVVIQTVIPEQKLYWTDEETEKIQRSNLDGTDVEDIIISGLKDPVSIALDESAGKMYWVDRNTDKIYRASLDGTKVKELVNTRGLSEPPSSSYKSAAPYGIALDVAGSKMYWTDQVQEKIWRANLDGSNVEALVNTTDLASDGTNPSSIALDVAGGKMYWANWDTNKIHRADLNGSNVEEVITSGVTFSRGITLDLINRKIYYTDTSTDKIRRANLDGTNVEELVDTRRIVDPPLDSGGTSPLDITLDVDGGKMYWADEKTAKIYRANLDGTQVEILPISGLQTPVGIAVISSK